MSVGCKLPTDSRICNPTFVPDMASEQERLGTSTGKNLHVLCYQHHTEMLLRLSSESVMWPQYSCQAPDCLIRYDSSQGYFIEAKDPKTLEEEKTPRVICPTDGQLTYLAEVSPQRRSFRLWKCPECNGSCTNEESSGGLEKKMGA